MADRDTGGRYVVVIAVSLIGLVTFLPDLSTSGGGRPLWGTLLATLALVGAVYRSRAYYGAWKASFVEGRREVLEELEAESGGRQAESWSVRSLTADYSPYEFERVVQRLYRAKGYRAERTSESGDAGLDVIARKGGTTVGIQGKRYSPGNAVGSPAVQNAIGAAIQEGCDEVVVVTTSGFTGPAEEATRDSSRNGVGVTLIDGRRLVRELDRRCRPGSR